MSQHNLYTNRLIKEKSPYLLQHAHNPVDWYPWGEEAFTMARQQDKPIFLSIGYATCHWCHVMEKESFENLEVAKLMNDAFINIKVDREELPEVDSLYMEFSQSMMAGAAGWPLNVILTPDLEPFFAATYLPAHASHGLAGLVDLIGRISEIWRGDERENVLEQAQQIVAAFSDHIHVSGEEIPDKEQIENSAEILLKMADPVHGGIRGVPKFPIGYQWNFMMRYASAWDDGRSLFLAERTLDMMQRGGIYDHLGGGFSRYSVDGQWLVPHFEKMLYDNALLIHSYLEGWQMTQNPFYHKVCDDIIGYILRDMTHSNGGFYSAEDADSEGHEGYFYTWTYDEIVSILGKESTLFCEFYGIIPKGNFEGRNILHTTMRLEEFCRQKRLEPKEFSEQLGAQKKLLWQVREQRVHPFKDDKILCSWNGLMIFSLAEAGAAFGNASYLDAAEKAVRFIKENMWKEGILLRRWREGEALYHAGLDEHAFLIRGLLSLYEAGRGLQWLEWAIVLTNILFQQFKAENGAFYQTDGKDAHIILRKCQFSDGAEPSGNAIHCENLLRLYQMTFNESYLAQAEDILRASKKYVDQYPPGYCYHMLNLIRYYQLHSTTAVIALNDQEQFKNELLPLFYRRHLPHRSILWKTAQETKLEKIAPFTAKQTPINGKTTLYLCEKGVCQKPMTELSEMIAAIHEL